MKSLALIALSLAFASLVCGSDDSDLTAIQILSLLQPRHVVVSLQQPATALLKAETGREVFQKVVSRIESLDVQVTSAGLSMNYNAEDWQTIDYQCKPFCTLRIEVPEASFSRTYHGNLRLQSYNNTISIVLFIPTNELIGSITASEMGECHEAEAYKAFAIVARSFLKSGGRHRDRGADFCDTTHCQVFRAIEPDFAVQEAVQATNDLILTYQQKGFRPFFSKSCGGKTATYQETWGKPAENYPFYSVACPYCANEKNQEWASIVPLQTIQKISGVRPDSIQLQNNWLLFSGPTSSVKMTLEDFRIRIGRMLGWKSLPGNQFDLERNGDQLEFRGRRIGHGIGLCQTGACEMAKRDVTFQQILQHYFPNTETRIPTN